MPKRRAEDRESQRHNGDLAGKRSRPARRRKHLYLVLDDRKEGLSIHKIDGDNFDSDSDEEHVDAAGHAGHLPEPPIARLEPPGNTNMLFTAMDSKIFIVTDAQHGQTPALVYNTKTSGLAIGPAVPSRRRCGFDVVVPVRGMFYAFSPPYCNEQCNFNVMSCASTGSHDPGEGRWAWRSLPSPQAPFSSHEVIASYAVHSDGQTIFMTTCYSDRPGIQKSTLSFNTKYSVWRWHPWILPFRDQGYFDSELDAWVGLNKDGYICSCELPTDVGSETPIELGTAQLDWQLADEKLFTDQETERNSRKSLA